MVPAFGTQVSQAKRPINFGLLSEQLKLSLLATQAAAPFAVLA
jgi:hypothetical protein